tara:strand:+ start:167 stop:364 length:198 start_codon:yes stop_codon:yes gene_type:complete
MTTPASQNILLDNQTNEKDSLVDSVRILSEITRRDIEKSYNIENIDGTEAYYSNRYGWTLKRTIF